MKRDYLLIPDNSRPGYPPTNSKTRITLTHSHQDPMPSIPPPPQQKVAPKPRRPRPQLRPLPVLKTSSRSSMQYILRRPRQKANPPLQTPSKMDAGAPSPCRVTINLLIDESQNGSVGLVMTMISVSKINKVEEDGGFSSLMHLPRKAKMNHEEYKENSLV